MLPNITSQKLVIGCEQTDEYTEVGEREFASTNKLRGHALGSFLYFNVSILFLFHFRNIHSVA